MITVDIITLKVYYIYLFLLSCVHTSRVNTHSIFVNFICRYPIFDVFENSKKWLERGMVNVRRGVSIGDKMLTEHKKVRKKTCNFDIHKT